MHICSAAVRFCVKNHFPNTAAHFSWLNDDWQVLETEFRESGSKFHTLLTRHSACKLCEIGTLLKSIQKSIQKLIKYSVSAFTPVSVARSLFTGVRDKNVLILNIIWFFSPFQLVKAIIIMTLCFYFRVHSCFCFNRIIYAHTAVLSVSPLLLLI